MEIDKKTIDALVEKFTSSEAIATITADIKNLQEGNLTMDSFKETFEGFAKAEDITDLKTTIEELGIEMKKFQEAGPEKVKSLREMLLEDDVKSKLDLMSKGNKECVTMTVKSDVVRASVTSHTLAMRLPDVGQAAYQSTLIANLFRQARVSPNNNGTIRYVDQVALTRNADTRAEAAQFPESAITWQEYNLPIEKLADSIPFSHEMMNDVDFVASELDRLLNVDIAILEDNQVYDGDGSTPNLKGVVTTATAFTDSTPKIQSATIYDLINVVATKVSKGKESKYVANKVLINPDDVLKMISSKDANDNYIVPPFVNANGNMIVHGVEVVSTPTVTTNTMLVGDFRWGTYYTSENFELEIGWVANQFIEDMFTLKARKRAALLVRTIDATAFYKVASITTALSNITA